MVTHICTCTQVSPAPPVTPQAPLLLQNRPFQSHNLPSLAWRNLPLVRSERRRERKGGLAHSYILELCSLRRLPCCLLTVTHIDSCSHTSTNYLPTNNPGRNHYREACYILTPSHWNRTTELPVAVEAWRRGGWEWGLAGPHLWWCQVPRGEGWSETCCSPGMWCRLLSVCSLQLCWKWNFTMYKPYCW